MNRPKGCLSPSCPAVDFDTCPMCINRSFLAKKGYDLIQAIENCGASVELTEAVNKAEEYIKIATQEGGQNAQQLQPIIAQLVKARSWLVDSLAAPIDDNAVKDIDAVLSRLRAM